MLNNNKIGFATFIGVIMAMLATVRSIPTLAASGWQMLFWIISAVIFFALPIYLMSGELSTMLQDAGGPQLWVKTALGSKWGFVCAWLLWVQMFPGMVMVASTLGPLLGNTFGSVTLANNHWFTLGCILVFYWLITILNLKFDMAKLGGAFGVWIGVYIPVLIMTIMGFLSFIKVGIRPNSVLGSFSVNKLFPTDISSLKYVGAISFIFLGSETAGVYVPRLKNASKDFARGLIIVLICLIFFNTVNAFFMSDVVGKGNTQLTNITQPIIIFCQILGWPKIIVNIFSLLVFIGVIFQLSGWITGPPQAIVQVAKEGLLPPKWNYQHENEYGISKNVIFTQSIGISLFALMYALPSINSVFLTLVNTTILLYCSIYILIAISYIKLRYSEANRYRPYHVGRKNSNTLAWMITISFVLSTVFIMVVSEISQTFIDSAVMFATTIILLLIPLMIYKYKNEQWYIDVQKDISSEKKIKKEIYFYDK